jgi:hypothetical protein
MRVPKKWGLPLLAVWLIAGGVLGLAPRLSFSGVGELLALLAIAAGALILLDR